MSASFAISNPGPFEVVCEWEKLNSNIQPYIESVDLFIYGKSAYNINYFSIAGNRIIY